MLSFWEQSEMLHADLTIVGGGITGLSIAASVLERHPKKRVRILERSVLPYGASTRNAGFACFGSPTELAHDVQLIGEEAARDLVFKRWMGIEITRKRLGDTAIGYIPSGGYELIQDTQWDAGKLEQLNSLVDDFLPAYFANADGRRSDLGIQAPGKLIDIQGEGQVNTGMLMRSLQRYVVAKGAELIQGAAVRSIQQNGDWEINVSDGLRGSILLKSDQVVVANNAFVQQLFPALEVKPGRGQVLLTEPIPGFRFKGNLHIEEGFYYLRDLGDRILFGGGRNLDMEGETTEAFELNNNIQQALEDYLPRLFGSERAFKIAQCWSGIMGFTPSKTPLMQEMESGLWAVVGLSGMGIALAGYLGEEWAEM